MDTEDYAIEATSAHPAASCRRGRWKRYPFVGWQRFEMEAGEPRNCQQLVDFTGREEQGVRRDPRHFVCRVGKKHRPLRRGGELPFVDSTDSGSLHSLRPFLRRSFIQSNLSQWEANPELPGDQQSLIDRFVRLRTVSEVCVFVACRKIRSIDLGFLHRTFERRCVRWENFLGLPLNPSSKRSC